MPGDKQLPLALPESSPDRGWVEARVERQEQVGEAVITFSSRMNLPVASTAAEMARAAQQQEALLQLCWEATTDTMVEVVLRQVGKPTLAMLRTLLQFMHRLNLTPETLTPDAAALGITLGERGVLGLTFEEASLLLDTLAYRVDQPAGTPASEAAPRPPVSAPSPRRIGPPAVPTITLENVNEVPLEQLLQLRVHWTRQHRGQTIEDLLHGHGPDKVRWFAGIGDEHQERWVPKPHPVSGEIAPQDFILQAACQRVYHWAVEQQQAQE